MEPLNEVGRYAADADAGVLMLVIVLCLLPLAALGAVLDRKWSREEQAALEESRVRDIDTEVP